jgi:MFS family permease
MGGASVCIGLLPDFSSIGLLAPIMLVCLRFIQGFALGGEFGGAALMLVENTLPGKRGLIGSAVWMGVPGGVILATIATYASSSISGSDFISWGWRVPFLISVLLVAIGFWIRRTLPETKEFKDMKRTKGITNLPIMEVVKKN